LVRIPGELLTVHCKKGFDILKRGFSTEEDTIVQVKGLDAMQETNLALYLEEWVKRYPKDTKRKELLDQLNHY